MVRWETSAAASYRIKEEALFNPALNQRAYEWALKGWFLKNNISVINYSPLCRFKPVRPSFIFGTQIKIFLMKSEKFFISHRNQCDYYHIQRPEK